MLFEAKCVKLLRSKVFLLSKVFFEAKCASANETVPGTKPPGAIIKIPVVRCHYLLCSSAQLLGKPTLPCFETEKRMALIDKHNVWKVDYLSGHLL